MRFIFYLASTLALFRCGRCQASGVEFKWEYLKSDGAFEIELSTPVSGDASQIYVAVAFALTPHMKDADGYYCVNGQLKSIALAEYYEVPFELESLQGAQLKAIITEGGKLTCTFTRPIRVRKTISNDKEHDFNLDQAPYNILLATGSLSDGRLTIHDKREALAAVDFSSKITDVTNPIDGSLCNTPGFKNCLQDPTGCSSNDPDCTFFSLLQVGNRMEMELSGKLGNGRNYVAVAFGLSSAMENADLYYCDGKSLRSGVIREKHTPPVDLDDKAVQVISESTVNGVGQCIFSRPLCVTKEVSSGVRIEFDFIASPYFILLAHGNMTADGRLTYHGDERLTTAEAHVLTSQMTDYQCVDAGLSPEIFSASKCDAPAPGSFCMRHPDNCYSSSPGCMFVSANQTGTNFYFEMSGGIGDGQEYIAVGFTKRRTSSNLTILFYCDGQSLKIMTLLDDAGDNAVNKSQAAVVQAEVETTRGIGHCRFMAPACITQRLPDGEVHLFDLFSDEYHVVMMRGVIQDGDIDYQRKNILEFNPGQPASLGTDYKCLVPEDGKDPAAVIGNGAMHLSGAPFLSVIICFLIRHLM